MLISQGAAFCRAFLMVLSSDHINGAGGKTVSGSIGKANGPFASVSTAITEAGGGWYLYTPTTSETDTLGSLRFAFTAASCDPTDFADQVVAWNPSSARMGVDWANVGGQTTVVNLTQTQFASVSVATSAGTVTTGITVVNVAANAIAAGSAVTAFYNRIIDIAARRQYTNIRSSSDGETIVRWSLLGAIARLVNRNDMRTQPATTYHEDASTSFFTETMTTASTADAVTQLT